jgi:hypothetical protein
MRKALPALLAALVSVSACGGCGGDAAIYPAPEVPNLRIGMSIADAKREIGQRFKLPYWNPQSSSICGNFQIEGTQIVGIVSSGRIAVVFLNMEFGEDGSPVLGSGAETLKGLRAGQSLKRAKELFGRPEWVMGGEGIDSELMFWRVGAEEGHGVFMRAGMWKEPHLPEGRIAALEVGVQPQVGYVEGCD